MKEFHDKSMEASISSKKELMMKMEQLIDKKSSKKKKSKSKDKSKENQITDDKMIKLEHIQDQIEKE